MLANNGLCVGPPPRFFGPVRLCLFTKSSDKDIFGSFSVLLPILCGINIQVYGSNTTLGTRAKNNKKKKIISFHLNFEALVPRVLKYMNSTQFLSQTILKHATLCS